MKPMTMAGAVLGLLALLLALAALATGGGGGEEAAEELGKLSASVSALEGRVVALRADLASAAGKKESASKGVADLRARVERAELEAERLGKAIAAIPEVPDRPAAAAAPAMDAQKLQELVQEQMRVIREEQGREMAERFRQGVIARLRDDVGLTEEKAGKVADVHRKTFEEMPRIWPENGGDRDAVRRAMEDLRVKAEKEMAEFLSEGELAKVREWGEQQMRRWGGGNRGGRGGRNRQPQDAGEGAGEGGGDTPAPF